MRGDFDIPTIYAGIATRLATVSPALRIYKTFPFTIDPPAAFFNVEEVKYDTAMNQDAVDLIILIMIATQFGSDRGETQLLEYMKPSGSSSVPNAIDLDETLNGSVSYSNISRSRPVQILDHGGAQFYVVPFELIVGIGK